MQERRAGEAEGSRELSSALKEPAFDRVLELCVRQRSGEGASAGRRSRGRFFDGLHVHLRDRHIRLQPALREGPLEGAFQLVSGAAFVGKRAVHRGRSRGGVDAGRVLHDHGSAQVIGARAVGEQAVAESGEAQARGAEARRVDRRRDLLPVAEEDLRALLGRDRVRFARE